MRVAKLTLEGLTEAVHEFVESVFGPRQGARDRLARWTADPSISVLGAWLGDQIVGISLVRLASDESLAKLLQNFGAAGKLEGRKVGDFQMLAVAPEHRKLGIAEALSRQQLEWLRAQGCDAFIGVCWEHGHGGSSAHLFRKAGFSPLATREGFYLQGSRDTNHRCPICQGECHCQATLYALVS